MRKKYVAIIAIMLILTLFCSQAGATEGNPRSNETTERLIEEYGLDVPEAVLQERSGIDVGISVSVDSFVMLCRFIASPLVFTIQKLL